MDLFKKTMLPVQQVLKDTAISKNNVNDIVIVSITSQVVRLSDEKHEEAILSAKEWEVNVISLRSTSNTQIFSLQIIGNSMVYGPESLSTFS
jgi:hypothetical protein